MKLGGKNLNPSDFPKPPYHHNNNTNNSQIIPGKEGLGQRLQFLKPVFKIQDDGTELTYAIISIGILRKQTQTCQCRTDVNTILV